MPTLPEIYFNPDLGPMTALEAKDKFPSPHEVGRFDPDGLKHAWAFTGIRVIYSEGKNRRIVTLEDPVSALDFIRDNCELNNGPFTWVSALYLTRKKEIRFDLSFAHLEQLAAKARPKDEAHPASLSTSGAVSPSKSTIAELRKQGHAVVCISPEELGSANPRRVQDLLIQLSWGVIDDLQ